MTPSNSRTPAGAVEDARMQDKIDPTRASSGVARWRRALADALGEDPGARLDQPDRRLTMLRVFGSTRRLADLCLKYPVAAADALVDGASLVLAQAARDLAALGSGVGGAEALYGALAPLKCRADLAIGLAEISGAWTAGEATAARADFAERLIDTAILWLLRGAINRGELAAQSESPSAGVFALAGGDFAHEDLAPYGPLDVAVIYDETAYSGPAARMAERAFVRLGSELRESFEGRPGDYPIFALKTPFGNAVSGQGLTETRARAFAALGDPQRGALRAWIATARVVAGDRRAGGAFLENAEEKVWTGTVLVDEEMRELLAAPSDDPRWPFRAVADVFRLTLGSSRPVFRTASARVVIETAAKSAVIERDLAARLAAGDEFAQGLVARAQMMKGAAAFGSSEPDEDAALADLCGFRQSSDLKSAVSGSLADARNTLRSLLNGRQSEFERFRPAGENPDDVDKLEDLGFQGGAAVSGLVDHWADIASRGAKVGRFSAIAPGLLTAFGETQRPDVAVRLFDEVLRHAPEKDDVVGRLAAHGAVREGMIDALGCFGAAVAPLTQTSASVRIFFEERGAEVPESGAEWLRRYPPPKAGAKISEIAAWRREAIARIALYTAARDMNFDAAAEALSSISDCVLARAFESVAKAAPGSAGIALHVFDGPARGLPGSPTLFGFIASSGETQAREGFARTYMDALEELGEGFFALAPDVSHRPAGVAGGLAPDVAAFKSFVQSEAVAYDQILLARARVIAGADKAQAAARGALRLAVSNPKRADILFRDLDRARAQRLRRDKASTEWDIDQNEGGLHDVELIISTLIYRHAAAQPGVQEGNVDAALDVLVRAGAVPANIAETLKSARAFWMRLATARALARWSDPQREPVRARFAALLARAAQVEAFSQVRPIMRGYADEVGRLYSQLVLGRPALSLVSNA
jgi:glutamate-ammonia-ligase adenylyltransferase